MKVLHTSDWHLGQTFFTQSRHAEHQAFFGWLLEQVEQHAVDCVIVAGDVFDTGTPPSYARQLYNQFVVDLQARGCVLVVLGGNHDSVSVLNESRQVLACLNTHVIASTGLAVDEQVLTMQNRAGEVGAIICAVPFIRPRDVLQSQAGESGQDKRQALGQAIKDHYATLYQKACDMRAALDRDVPIIATGHLTALGVKQSDSVRDIYIGTLEGFAAEGFPPADYIALGHIHRPQKVAKSDTIRYSGSPIALSFDELKHDKQVVLADFSTGTTPHITPLAVPVFQPMASHSGDLEGLEAQLQQYQDADTTVWLSLEVHTQDYLSDLHQRVQAMTEALNVEVLQLRRARNRTVALNGQQRETLTELSVEEVFARRLAAETFETDTQQRQVTRIQACFDSICAQVKEEQA